MRYRLFFALALAACSRGPAGAHPPLSGGTNGPDAVLIRLVQSGGTARAYRWGSDSVLWSSPQRIPALSHTLAFDDAQGSLAYVDSHGVPGRLDFRVGSASAAANTALSGLVSADGWAIYGLTPRHDVSRLTPSGTWTFTPERAVRALLPLSDGSLVLLSDDGNRHDLRRLHPPEPRVTESASVPHADLLVRTDLGDRLYFIGDSGLAGVRTRDLSRTRTVWLPGQAVDAVATPSGDRIFVALKGKKEITVVDRYAEEIEGTIDLAGPVTALRMDPDGRYLLARSAGGDSVRVIAIGTSRAIGAVRSTWRADLPLVGPDGGLAAVQDSDVVVVDAESHAERARFPAGASDLWTLVRWNGFRPRAKGLDIPVSFDSDSDSTAAAGARADSAKALPPTSVAAAASAARPPETGARPAETPAPRAIAGAQKHSTWTLSFAALLSEERAKTLAASITVDGHPVRVVPGVSDRTPVYRVVYGPFDTKEDADRAGKKHGPSVLGVRGRAVTESHDARQSWWEDEGARIAGELHDVGALLVVGANPEDAARVALGIARAESGRRHVALGDLVGDLAPLYAVAGGEDAFGLTDCLRQGLPLNDIARPAPDRDSLFILPAGSPPVACDAILAHERWPRLVNGFAKAGALLMLVAPLDAPGISALAAAMGAAVLVDVPPDRERGFHALARVSRPAPATARHAQPRTRPKAGTRRTMLLAGATAIVLVACAWLARAPINRAYRAVFARRAEPAAAAPPAPPPPPADTVSLRDPVNPVDTSATAAFAVEVMAANTLAGANSFLSDHANSASLAGATVSPVAVGGSSSIWYMVDVGASHERAGADSILAALRRERLVRGEAGRVVRLPYALVLETGVDRSAAPRLRESWRQRGFNSYFLMQNDGSVRLFAGAFETPAQAASLAAALRAAGVAPVLAFRTGRTY